MLLYLVVVGYEGLSVSEAPPELSLYNKGFHILLEEVHGGAAVLDGRLIRPANSDILHESVAEGTPIARESAYLSILSGADLARDYTAESDRRTKEIALA